ncbi:MAG: energy-coupling factor ABC transporter permease [Bacillota bacterium]
MHIPDGFLDPKTLVGTAVASAGAVGYAASRLSRELEERQVPVLAAMSAFVFAAQMVNFPIAGGTSGHLLGGALITILFGPWAASLSLTAVLIIQALLFGDGGVTALGANVFNMAVIGTLTAHLTYRMLRRGAGFHPVAAFLASWLSVLVAALAAALELGIAGTVPLRVAVPAMASWHALIGLGEGIITTAVLAYVARVRPALLGLPETAAGGIRS